MNALSVNIAKTGLMALALGVLLAACGGSAPDHEPAASASGHDGQAVAVAQDSSAEAAACARAGGDWNTGTGRCAINAAMCASTAGRWIEGTGCAVDATDEAACKALAGSGGLDGFQGIQWAQGRCVLTYLAGDELASQGF